jgi:Na+/proline symporter
MFALVVAHIPLGLLPHIGNKLWALKDERSRNRFLIMAFTFGLVLPGIALGGATARAVLGDSLLGGGANTALPALFIEMFPAWLAALLGVGILAAVMSTADGLVISTSQVFANDIYRKSIVPRAHKHLSEAEVDKNVLLISRVGTVLTLIGAATLAWAVKDKNVVLLIWAGVGCFIAAMAGPLVLGSVWNGVSRAGAISGFWTGAVAFILIHARILSFGWLDGTSMQAFGQWFDFNATSPYSAATMGAIASVVVTTIVSRCSAPVVDGETATTTAEHTQ